MDAAFRHTGPRRYCGTCKKQVSTYHGRFTVHFDAATGKACPGSDQPVPKLDERPTPAPLADA